LRQAKPEEGIVTDQLNHASIIDGVRLCKAKRFVYANADMADLEAKLQEAQSCRFRLIVTDGVFSMDGSVAPLPEICALPTRTARRSRLRRAGRISRGCGQWP
jgi:glycine C-acetyltransferase